MVQAFAAGFGVAMLMSGNQGCQLAGSAAAKIATPEPASFGRAAQLAHGRAERAVAIGAPEGDSICTVPLSPRQRECLARGQAFKANLPSAEPQQGPNPFDAPFVSPITTARDPVFFEYAARTPTDKVGAHGEEHWVFGAAVVAEGAVPAERWGCDAQPCLALPTLCLSSPFCPAQPFCLPSVPLFVQPLPAARTPARSQHSGNWAGLQHGVRRRRITQNLARVASLRQHLVHRL